METHLEGPWPFFKPRRGLIRALTPNTVCSSGVVFGMQTALTRIVIEFSVARVGLRPATTIEMFGMHAHPYCIVAEAKQMVIFLKFFVLPSQVPFQLKVCSLNYVAEANAPNKRLQITPTHSRLLY